MYFKLIPLLCVISVVSTNMCYLRSLKNETSIVNFLTQLITYAFHYKNYIVYSSNGCFLSKLVETALTNSKIATTVLPYDNLNDYPDSLNFDGYLIVSNNYSSLVSIFDRPEQDHFQFKPHKRALVFYNWKRNFHVHPFTTAATTKGIDIMIIQGFKLNLLKEFNCKSESNEIEILFLRNNKTISWSSGDLDKEDFVLRWWKPSFISRPFRPSAFNCTPFIFIKDGKVYNGLEFRIMEEIARINKWPIDYKIVEIEDNVSPYSNVIQALIGKEADIGLCSQWLTVIAKKGMDVTYPYTQLCISFLVPKPKLLPEETLVFQPLEITVWITFITVIVIVSLITIAFSKFIYKEVDYSSYVLDVIRISTLSSLPKFPCSGWYVVRIILTAWCVNALLINTGYSAGFTSSITKPKFTQSISTLEDMVEHNIRWGGPDLANKETLTGEPNIHVRKLLENYDIEPSVAHRNKRIQAGKYAVYVKILPGRYITETQTLDYFGKKHLKVLKECASESYIVFALRKNSPYTRVITNYIMRFNEHGLITYWDTVIRFPSELNQMSNFYSSYAHNIGEKSPLTVVDIEGAFFILFVGLSLSLIVFGCELVYFNCYLKVDKKLV